MTSLIFSSYHFSSSSFPSKISPKEAVGSSLQRRSRSPSPTSFGTSSGSPKIVKVKGEDIDHPMDLTEEEGKKVGRRCSATMNLM